MVLPKSWGFIGDLRKCAGKTIEDVELAKLGYSFTVSTAWVIRFTDGTRAFITHGTTEHSLVRPTTEWMQKESRLFTPEEVAERVAEDVRDREGKRLAREREERRQLERLQKEVRCPRQGWQLI